MSKIAVQMGESRGSPEGILYQEPQTVISNPTTGFLTATTFIYAIRAGITAAAGTRLAL